MKALVTGGGGFLGSAIVRRLLDRGDSVRSFSRSEHPELETIGAETYRGDIADFDSVLSAAEGCEIIFHVAAKAEIWGPKREFHRTNVLGTQNMLEACAAHRIEKFVYTSSPSVVFDGWDADGIDESYSYPNYYFADYPSTKATAEKLVLGANGPKLATVALRPHLIWGPGDNHLVPRLISRARAKKLRLVGDGQKLVDSTYIDNAAHAHLLAADRLAPGSPVAGKAYFISQDQPLPMAELINRILAAGGLGPVTRTIPPRFAFLLGWLLEIVYELAGLKSEPPMTRFLARQLSTAHWFDISAARQDLGYEPEISLDEGLSRLAKSLEETQCN